MTSGLNLSAKWTALTYTMIFYNGSTEVTRFSNIIYRNSKTLPSAPTPIPTGKKFGGWKYGTDTYNASASFVITNTNIPSSGTILNFYAQWVDEGTTTYSITYIPNGGVGNSETVSGQTSYYAKSTWSRNSTQSGDVATLYCYKEDGTTLYQTCTSNIYNVYSLSSWNTKSDGTGTTYAKGELITPTSDLTLYAIWNTSSQYSEITDIGAAPSVSGYTWTGWWNAVSGGSLVISASTTSYTPTASITKVYAQYTENAFSVTLSGDHCSFSSSSINGPTGYTELIYVTFDDGYTFDKIASKINCEATYNSSNKSLSITIGSANGSIILNTKAKQVQTVTFTTDSHCSVNPTSSTGVEGETAVIPVGFTTGYELDYLCPINCDAVYSERDREITITYGNTTSATVEVASKATAVIKTVTLTGDSHCTFNSTTVTGYEGDSATVQISFTSGYGLSTFTYNGCEAVYDEDCGEVEVTFGSTDGTVTATSGIIQTVTFTTDSHCSVNPTSSTGVEGETAVIQVGFTTGYELDYLYPINCDAVYSERDREITITYGNTTSATVEVASKATAVIKTVTLTGDSHCTFNSTTVTGYEGDSATVQISFTSGYGLSTFTYNGCEAVYDEDCGEVEVTFGSTDGTVTATSGIIQTVTITCDSHCSTNPTTVSGASGTTSTVQVSFTSGYDYSYLCQTNCIATYEERDRELTITFGDTPSGTVELTSEET